MKWMLLFPVSFTENSSIWLTEEKSLSDIPAVGGVKLS